MRITESQLRSIINEELARTVLTEAAVETGKTTNQWLKDTGLQAKGAGYTAAYKDSPYYALDNAARKPGNWTGRSFGDPFTYDDLGDDKIQVVTGPVKRSIGAVISKSSYKQQPVPTGGGPKPVVVTTPPKPAPGGGGGGAKGPQCQLPNYKGSLTTELGKAGLAGVQIAFTVDLLLTGSFRKATADGMARTAAALQTLGSETPALIALRTAVSLFTGGLSEGIMAVIATGLSATSGLISGIMSAQQAFTRTCDLNRFASDCGAAFSSFVSSWVELARQGLNKFLAGLKKAGQVAIAALDAFFTAIGVGAIMTGVLFIAIIDAALGLVAKGAVAIQGLISAALIAAGKALQATGQAIAPAAPAKPISEARRRLIQHQRRDAVRQLALEIHQVSRANQLLSSLGHETRMMVIRDAI